MTDPLLFTVEKKLDNGLGRAGVLRTPHGNIQTPAFVSVGTKASVKALTPEQLLSTNAQVALANTYHLYFQPGADIVESAGGLHSFMHWDKPLMTDSGGFQAFSLGAAYGKGVSKVAKEEEEEVDEAPLETLAKITENGVSFTSPFDGSIHMFTPESSIEIQQKLGADMIFAFDECTSPRASKSYQEEAMERTHRWAVRSLEAHHKNKEKKERQGLFGIVQGGRFEDLRKKSAEVIGAMPFDGFGIGGSFTKEDMYTVVGWVNRILPENKPRHLLGIGEPMDLLGGIENGADLFDCVAPTRMARNGSLHTKNGRINLFNAQFKNDFTKVEDDCDCYTCTYFTRAYLAHLYRAKEMLAGTLGSIHNLRFTIRLVENARKALLEGNFIEYKEKILSLYYSK